VRVQTQNNAVAARQMGVHPFNLVGIAVGRGHFDGAGQIEDYFIRRRRAPSKGYGIANFQGKIELGRTKSFGAVL